MSESSVPEIEFPTDYMFKAFGRADVGDAFIAAVKKAVNATVPCPDDAIRCRTSSGGKYLCVTALTHLTSQEQMYAIYKDLKAIDGLLEVPRDIYINLFVKIGLLKKVQNSPVHSPGPIVSCRRNSEIDDRTRRQGAIRCFVIENGQSDLT